MIEVVKFDFDLYRLMGSSLEDVVSRTEDVEEIDILEIIIDLLGVNLISVSLFDDWTIWSVSWLIIGFGMILLGIVQLLNPISFDYLICGSL